MASKMKNIYHKKTSLFYPEDGFHPKILHGLSEEPNPLKELMYITPPRATFRNKYSALSNLDLGFDFPEKENYRVIYRVIDKYRVIILILGENTG